MKNTHIIHLKECQRTLTPVIHPLFQTKIPPESLAELALRYIKDRSVENRDLVILRTLPLLRHLIGRFLKNWPITRNYLDDIVSVGALSICKSTEWISDKHLEYLATYLLGNARKEIEKYLNDNRFVAAPRLKKNIEERRDTGKPIYLETHTNNTVNISTFDSDIEMLEAFEILQKLVLTQDEQKYLTSLIKGNMNSTRGRTSLQRKFEEYLRSL